MTGAPTWIYFLQILVTASIGVLAGVIGVMQWRTAHQKVALDLFDRRMVVYETTWRILRHAISRASIDLEILAEMQDARLRRTLAGALGDSHPLIAERQLGDQSQDLRRD
jgi:hypothetical protein